MKYDVVVVGGRLAGSTSSLFASKGGLDVLMIEKRQEIGTPVQCAEATTKDTFNILEMDPSKKYICADIDGVDFYAPNGKHFRIRGNNMYGFREGYVLERKIFDKHLAIESARCGTDIMVKTTVKDLIIKNGKVCGVVAKHLDKTFDIKADIVIAADGIESNIARMAGLKTFNQIGDMASCAQYEMVGVKMDPNYLQIHHGQNIAPGGYLWMFPKGNGVANVGLGVLNAKETAYYYLTKFIEKLDATPVELNIGGVPLSGPIEKTFSSGLMVVGDAAGQVDPMNGAGIQNTVTCGRIAGEIAVESIESEDTSSNYLKKYEDLWRLTIGNSLETSLKYQKIFQNLNDDDFNVLAEFLENKNIESISKLSILKFLKDYPHLITLLFNVFILKQ
ncbi:geranylgeranyl reductase family protein [Methanobacterium alcaliphilum]|uniref:geranylgeranyl reductase family protein n=1 Tax=Methanobacterium alcaliphilum TaxID=392018 RepID=UPI00200AB4C9|nr:NAD(P)/FAD-dependent oxidoreductase [Methanobacterium alcaliphilum]MCK9151431.1 NAD(P)/FAD-dependent oxidoreductase [Methanobacterium alcaliphilum]